MSYQAQPAVVVSARPERIRHDNSESLSLGSGTKDLLFTLGAIGIGAFGAYYLVDYIMKGHYLDNILPTNTTPANNDTGDTDTQSNLARIEIQEPFDRYTKVNSYIASMHRGKQAPSRLPVTEIDDDIDFEIEGADDLAFNQVFTDDRVFEVI